eukprot:11953959-Ditylum_brightwellii.AAC.1
MSALMTSPDCVTSPNADKDRHLGKENYTAEYTDIDARLDKMRNIIPKDNCSEVERGCRVGSPNILVTESPKEELHDTLEIWES